MLTRKPNIFAAVHQFQGQVSVFHSPHGPCYRCLFPEPPPAGSVLSCAEAGVMGVLPGVLGLLQATEAIKLIIGRGTPLIGRLMLYDALDMDWRTIRVRRNPQCPVCGDNPTIKELIDYEIFCSGRSAKENHMKEISVAELKERLAKDKDAVLIDVRNPNEYDAGHIEGSKLIPLPSLNEKMGELEPYKNRELLVYCQRGGRSAQACENLEKAGYNVTNIRGGYADWEKMERK